MEFVRGTLIGIAGVIEPINLLVIIGGVIVGVIFGSIPGISCIIAISLLVPYTYYMTPEASILLLTAIYCAGVYAGSATAILFNIPGAPENVPASFDGYPLAQKGQAGKAIGLSIICSCIGGLFSTVVLIIVASQVAKIALAFGPAEYFAITFLGLSVITSLGSISRAKALLAGFMGLFLVTIGVSPIGGTPRFTFGSEYLLNGITFIPAMIGLFAASEVFHRASLKIKEKKFEDVRVMAKIPSLKELYDLKWVIVRSCCLGSFLGALPGVGATVSSFLGYTLQMRFSKQPERMGTGIYEGVAAPETANNAATGGTFILLLTMGIPGGAVAALLLAAFEIHGINPGPQLFLINAHLVYTIYAGMVVANLLIVLGGLSEVKTIVKLLKIPYSFLFPGIMLMCVVGSYAIHNDITDVWFMFLFGVLGYFMKKNDFPIPALVLALVLGPIAEESFVRLMVISQNNPLILFSRPVSGFIIVICILYLFYPLFILFYRKINKGTQEA